MTPKPSGRLLSTKDGRDLVLIRSFRAPIEDVWASITESERTGRWFASWTGDPGPGKTIRATLEFEEGKPETDMTIDVCEPPRHLAVSSHDVYGTWRLEATLAERDGVTELTFVQHLDDGVGIGEVGPGWEYYLDNLVASRDGSTRPQFDDYYPSQKEYYEQLTPTTSEASPDSG
jgi:uncharacterized protein YndB with AHSA1/START domain